MKQTITVELAGGKQITFETGRIAKQASGAAFVTSGDTVVLATAVGAPEPKEGVDFFPLTVEYRETAYGGGRIPGGFIKREGRPRRKSSPPGRSIGPAAPCSRKPTVTKPRSSPSSTPLTNRTTRISSPSTLHPAR